MNVPQEIAEREAVKENSLLEEVMAAAEDYLSRSLEADDLEYLAAELRELIPPDWASTTS